MAHGGPAFSTLIFLNVIQKCFPAFMFVSV